MSEFRQYLKEWVEVFLSFLKCDDEGMKKELEEKLTEIFEKLINYPGDKMDPQDFSTLNIIEQALEHHNESNE